MHLPMGTTKNPQCPTCKTATDVQKIIKAPMVHFKGSGFYKTDSVPKASVPKEKPKETPAPKTEPKPASPPPPKAP